MGYYPIFVELAGKTVLVVGGGGIAQRKVESLLGFGASISLVSKSLTSKLHKLVEEKKVSYLGEKFREEYLEGAALVIAATNDRQLNHKISESARKRHLLVNAVDQPLDCNFIFPSIVNRGGLLIAISTSGKSPALAKKIRKELEAQFGNEYATFLVLMGRLRKEILSKELSQEENSRIFHKIIDSSILDFMSKGDWKAVEATLRQLLPWDLAIEDLLEGFGVC